MSVRHPAVADLFYPGDPSILKSTVQSLLQQTNIPSSALGTPSPKALVVPHAGYIYSGPIAASAYAPVIQMKDKIKKIVILGPAHTLYFKGIAYDPVDQFETPLGTLDQDKDLLAKISDLPYVIPLHEAHQREHCLEVQWPFCQMIFPQFTLLPLVVGETTEAQVAEVLERVAEGDDTLIIISTDLSHYLPYDQAEKNDTKTCIAIDTLNSASIAHQDACGYYPLRGFLRYARQKKFQGCLLDLRNSGDTAGVKEKVVGYASYHFYQNLRFAEHCADELLCLAKESLRLYAEKQQVLAFNSKKYNKLLQIRAPSFVTLKKKGILRGCMGSLQSNETLAENVIYNSIRAGFSDPRFPKLDATELTELSISISILSPLEPMTFENEHDLKSQLMAGIDGLVLLWASHQATFLPSVWESMKNKDEFMEHLKLKMGLPADFWSKKMKAWRFTTEYIE